MEIITIMLLQVGSVGSAFYSSSVHHAQWMKNTFIAIISGLGGTVAGFAAIYLLVQNYGWLNGLLFWLSSGISIAILIRWTQVIFPIVFGISQILMIAGFYLWFATPTSDPYKEWKVCGENAVNAAEAECKAEGERALAFCFGAGGHGVYDQVIMSCGYEPLTSKGAIRTESCDLVYNDLYLECVADPLDGGIFSSFYSGIYAYLNPDIFSENRLAMLCTRPTAMSREDLGRLICGEP